MYQKWPLKKKEGLETTQIKSFQCRKNKPLLSWNTTMAAVELGSINHSLYSCICHARASHISCSSLLYSEIYRLSLSMSWPSEKGGVSLLNCSCCAVKSEKRKVFHKQRKLWTISNAVLSWKVLTFWNTSCEKCYLAIYTRFVSPFCTFIFIVG